MRYPLREHQQRCHDILWEKRFGMDLSEMGTGKTITALSLIERSGLKAAVVVPAYLIGNWESEIKKFTNLSVDQYKRAKKEYDCDILLISYAVLHQAEKQIKGRKFLAADEAHYLANPQSKRSKAFKSIVRRFKLERLLLMTGTILRNSVSELWHPFTLCDYGHARGFRKHFNSKYTFCDTYQHRVIKKIYGRQIVSWEGKRNETSLRKWLAAYSVRVKTEELADLPPLLRIPLVCRAPNKTLDAELMEAYEEWSKGVIGGANIHSVKAINAAAKVPFTLAFVEELLDENRGPVLVFTDHVRSCERLCEGLAMAYRVGMVHGSTPMAKRVSLIDHFQSSKLDVLVATIGSMSLGVTLTEANVVVFNDKNFDPSQNRQAIGRLLRIGQRAEKVLCYDILREGVDQRIDTLVEEKLNITNDILEEFEGADLDW